MVNFFERVYKKIGYPILTVFAGLALTACSGGGGTGSTSGGSATITGPKVTGVASKGILQGATIKAYAVDEAGNLGQRLGNTATTDANGAYTLNIGAYNGNVLIEATGGNYVDEASPGTPIANTATFRAAVTSVTGDISVAVTPFTEIAVQKAGAWTSANIQQANTVVSNMLGGINIISTMPANVIDPSSITATTNSKNYGLALAALSQMVANNTAASVTDAISKISTDLADSQLDAVGANLSDAFTAFVGSVNNKTDLTGSTKTGAAISQYSTSAIPATAYAVADLAGTWYSLDLGTQQNGGADNFSYEANTVAIQPDGSFTSTITACAPSCSAGSGVLSLSADGTVGVSPIDFGEYAYGAMNAGRDIIVANYGNQNSNDLIVYAKKASSYSTSDLAGTWHLRSIGTQQNGSADNFTYGAVTVDVQADGSAVQTPLGCTAGTKGCYQYSTTFSITADGIVEAPTGPTEYGYSAMSANKDVIATIRGYNQAIQGQDPTNVIVVWVKKAASYSMADLVGTWHKREFGTQQNGKPDGFVYEAGTVVIKADGSTVDMPVACNNGCSAYSTTASIAADGTVSVPVVAGEYFYGAMNAGKDVIVINYGDADDNRLVIMVKKADW